MSKFTMANAYDVVGHIENMSSDKYTFRDGSTHYIIPVADGMFTLISAAVVAPRMKGSQVRHACVCGFVKSNISMAEVRALLASLSTLNGGLAYGHYWVIGSSGAQLKKYRDARYTSGVHSIIAHGGNDDYFYGLSPRSASAKRFAELSAIRNRIK